MAVRESTNHYPIEKIQRRNWIALAQQVGLGAAAAERLMEGVIESTDSLIGVEGNLMPDNFPMDKAEAVFNGMRKHSTNLVSFG